MTLAPLSKYIVVQYWPDGYWDISKTQYLTSLKKAKEYVKYCNEYMKDDDLDPTTFRIFKLTEIE